MRAFTGGTTAGVERTTGVDAARACTAPALFAASMAPASAIEVNRFICCFPVEDEDEAGCHVG